MITECVVFEGLYYNEAGFEISPAELAEAVKHGPVAVWDDSFKFLGRVIQVRRVDGCLEGLMET